MKSLTSKEAETITFFLSRRSEAWPMALSAATWLAPVTFFFIFAAAHAQVTAMCVAFAAMLLLTAWGELYWTRQFGHLRSALRKYEAAYNALGASPGQGGEAGSEDPATPPP